MAATITSLFDGKSYPITDGVPITIVVGGRQGLQNNGAGITRGFYIQWDESFTAGQPITDAAAHVEFGGDLAAQLMNRARFTGSTGTGAPDSPIVYSGTVESQLSISLDNTITEGNFYFYVTYTGRVTIKLLLIIRVAGVLDMMLAPALSWLPGELVDLRLDLRQKTISSNALLYSGGLTQGETVKFAVLLTLAGEEITASVDAIELAIIAAIGDQEKVYVVDAASVAVVNVGAGENYFLLEVSLDDPTVAGWFAELDDTVDSGQLGTNTPSPLRLSSVAQLSVTYSGQRFTSITFPLPIYQAANKNI